MEITKNTLKSKAKMVVRTVFRGKRRLVRNTSQNSSLKLFKVSSISGTGLVAPRSFSKETILSGKTKVKHLIQRFNANKESISVDNIQKAKKEEKLLVLKNENDKLKIKIKTQKRQIEDLKVFFNTLSDKSNKLQQSNSSKCVAIQTYDELEFDYFPKIEYLNTLSDKSSKLQESASSKTVAIQTFDELDFDYFPFESDHVELNQVGEIKRQLYKQTLVTKCVCSKYIKLKTFKDTLMEKMIKSDNFYKMFISEIMQNFEECRISFALARAESLEKGTVDHVLEKNARLAYNNAAMQLELFRLEKEIKSLKSTTTPPTCSEADFAIIKAVKDKSNEYSMKRKSSKNKSTKQDWPQLYLSGYEVPLPHHQISDCGTVISVPVPAVDNGRITYRMTPMFEKVNDLKEYSQQPISVTIKRSLTKMSEYNPDLIVPSQTIKDGKNIAYDNESRTKISISGLN